MPNTTPTYKITGADAIRLAERDSLTIHCHANPLDDGGVVSPEIAKQIVKDDPSLVYVHVTIYGWVAGRTPLSELPGYNVADYFTSTGMYLGPDDEGVEPRWADAD